MFSLHDRILHVVVEFSDPSELPASIRDAVHRQLADFRHTAAVPYTPLIQQLARTLLPSLCDTRWRRGERAA